MRVLFITNCYPVPTTNGLAMRTFSLIQGLSAIGCDLDLVAFQQQPLEAQDEVQPLCRTVQLLPITISTLSSGGSYLRRLRALASSLPYGAFSYRSAAMQDAIRQLLAGNDYAAIFCDTLDAAVNLPSQLKVPLIINEHNVEHLILRRYLQWETNPMRRAYAWMEAKKLRRWERIMCARAALILACSEYDRQELMRLYPGANIAVVPNVVDSSTYEPVPSDDGARVLYTGGMDWYPNRDAVQFFAFSMLPEIQKRVPAAQFVVAGRNPSPEFQAKFAGISGLTFTGTVPDMRPELAKATVVVVPLRIGSGTRLKILEAAAMGKAMVSTRLGAEGLVFVNGKEILLADDRTSFAAAVVDLLNSRQRREQLGAAARQRVEQKYDRSVLRSVLKDTLAASFRTKILDSGHEVHAVKAAPRDERQPVPVVNG